MKGRAPERPRRLALSLHRPIGAPDPGAARRDIEEQEAEEEDRLAAVGDRIETLAAVDQPIAGRRHAARDESGGAGKDADDDQYARDQLDEPRDRQHRPERHRNSGRDIENILKDEREEKQPSEA